MKKKTFKYKACSDTEGIILRKEQDIIKFFEYIDYPKYSCKDAKVYVERAIDNSFIQWVFMSSWGIDQGELTNEEFTEIMKLFIKEV